MGIFLDYADEQELSRLYKLTGNPLFFKDAMELMEISIFERIDESEFYNMVVKKDPTAVITEKLSTEIMLQNCELFNSMTSNHKIDLFKEYKNQKLDIKMSFPEVIIRAEGAVKEDPSVMKDYYSPKEVNSNDLKNRFSETMSEIADELFVNRVGNKEPKSYVGNMTSSNLVGAGSSKHNR